MTLKIRTLIVVKFVINKSVHMSKIVPKKIVNKDYYRSFYEFLSSRL